MKIVLCFSGPTISKFMSEISLIEFSNKNILCSCMEIESKFLHTYLLLTVLNSKKQ